jgi:hypothetical protein
MARTVLIAPFTTYFDPSGNDATGDGSLAHPFATPGHAYAVLQTAYDLNGQNVVIQQKTPGIVRCADSFLGSLIGQTNNPAQVTIQGSATDDPLDAWNYMLSPAPSGHANSAITVSRGARLTITGFGFDNTYAIQNGAGQAEAGIFINTGNDVNVWIGTVAFGFNGGQAWINGQAFANILFISNIGVYPAQTTATATTLSTASKQAMLSGVSGPPILQGAGVHGAGIATGTFVVSYTAGVVTFNQPPTVNGTGIVLTFCDSATSGIGIGEFSYACNGANYSGGFVSLKGNPRLPFGFMFVDNAGVVNWAGLPVVQAETLQPLVATGSPASKQITLSTTAGIASGFTVTGKLAGGMMFPWNTKVDTIDDATHATLTKVPVATFSSKPIRIGYGPAQIDGPQLSAWQLSSINLGGTIGMLPGTPPVLGGANAPGSVSTGSQVQ